MLYQKFEPRLELKPFVECYYVWQSTDGPVANLVLESPPTGFCSIVFNTGDPYFLQNRKYERLAVPQQFIAGQSIYSYKLFLDGNISVAGIVFKPAALATLFNLPTYEYTEERIDLLNVFRKDFIENYRHKIAEAADTPAKAKLLEDFVMHQYNLHRPEPDSIDQAANQIVAQNGLLNMNELMENVFMSRRNFERKFFKKVGLSPKYYARIRRMAYLMNLIAGKKKVDWPTVFSDCEFYDRSHFIKDFIEFTGRTPQQYLQENSELANLVEKPKQQPLP